MAYNSNLPADNSFISAGPGEIRENNRALKDDRIVDAGFVAGLTPGNASGNIPISNNTVCTNLNADKLDGQDATAFAPIGHVNSTTGHPAATTGANGMMSNTDKSKLDGIAAGAEVNQNAFSAVAVSGQSNVVADSKTDTLTLIAGTGISLTTDAANDTVTFAVSQDGHNHVNATTGSAGFMAAADKSKLDGIAAGAEVNQNAFGIIAVSGQSNVEADAKVDTLTLVAGTNISITTNAAGDSITINDTYTHPATHSADILVDGTTNKAYTATEKTKLGGIASNADVTSATNVGSSIHGATAKTTLADADTVPLNDSAAANVLKKITWANVKAAILGVLLTGLSTATATAVTTTDSILVGIGKLQAQINNMATTIRGTVLTGLSLATATAVTSADSILVAIGKLQAQLGLYLPLAGGTMTGNLVMNAKVINEASASVASATTCDIGAAAGNYVAITGTTTITALGTVQAGTRRHVRFAGALTLTHNATSLILPTGANITTAAGDTATFISLGSGNWVCVQYQRADGQALISAASSGVVEYLTPGTYSWTAPAGVTQVEIEICAGGGGGSSSGSSESGAGGGAGEYKPPTLYDVTPGTAYSVVVGDGGLGATTPSSNGVTGENSSVGALVSANGGIGGTREDAGGVPAGGASGGGNYSYAGGNGGGENEGFAAGMGGHVNVPSGAYSCGGWNSGKWGDIPAPGRVSGSSAVGQNGTGYGAGGGGGRRDGGNTTVRSGGKGAPGFVRIRW